MTQTETTQELSENPVTALIETMKTILSEKGKVIEMKPTHIIVCPPWYYGPEDEGE